MNMKKILTAFLLLAFCATPCVYAGEAIIIDSNGQARYEDDSKNEVIKLDKVVTPTITQKDSTTVITTRKQENNSDKEVKDVAKIEVKTLDFSDKELQKYDKEFKNYVKNAPKSLKKIKKILDDNKYSLNMNDNKISSNCYKFELQDGDYAIWNKGKYAVEYHKDGKIMGIVKFENPKHSSNKGVLVCYEYRFDSSNVDKNQLKHVMVFEAERKYNEIKNIQIFMYLSNGHLRCAQINDQFYVAKNDKNIIPSLEIYNFAKSSGTFNQTTMENAKETVEGAFHTIGGVIWLTGVVVLIGVLCLFDRDVNFHPW